MDKSGKSPESPRTNRENRRKIGKGQKRTKKSQKGQKRTKKEGQVQIGKRPRLKHPRLAALESYPQNITRNNRTWQQLCTMTVLNYHSSRNFYKLIPLPVFLLDFFFAIFTGIRCGTDFFCNSHALLGESRGYCTKTKQEWPDSGSKLGIFFL